MSIRNWKGILGGVLALVACGSVACGSVKESDPDGGGGGGGGGGEDAGGETPGFVLSVPPDPIDVRLGESADVDVTVERTGGFDGDVAVEVSELPAGVSAGSLTIPGGETAGVLTVAVAESAAEGQALSLGVQGTAGELADSAELGLFLVGLAGTMDQSFGDGGEKLLATPDATFLQSMVRQPDGKLVLGGRKDSTLIVIRLEEDGALDADFATGSDTSTSSIPSRFEASPSWSTSG